MLAKDSSRPVLANVLLTVLIAQYLVHLFWMYWQQAESPDLIGSVRARLDAMLDYFVDNYGGEL